MSVLDDELEAALEWKHYGEAKTHVRWLVLEQPVHERESRSIEVAMRHQPARTATRSVQCKECEQDWPCWTYTAITGER